MIYLIKIHFVADLANIHIYVLLAECRHHFNNPDIIMDAHMVDELMRGLIMTPMETIDNRSVRLTCYCIGELGNFFLDPFTDGRVTAFQGYGE